MQPGTVLGPLRAQVASDTGLTPMPVIAPASHDTAAAVAAVPARGQPEIVQAYISSRHLVTAWARRLPALPLLTDAALANSFTNEGGVGGTIRLLKNIMGLWLVQECRRAWERARNKTAFGYEDLTRLAAAAPAFVSLVDPDNAAFMLPPSMPAALAEFCRKHRASRPPANRRRYGALAAQPGEPGAEVPLGAWTGWKRCSGRRLDVMHVVGGGHVRTRLAVPVHRGCLWPARAGGSC